MKLWIGLIVLLYSVVAHTSDCTKETLVKTQIIKCKDLQWSVDRSSPLTTSYSIKFSQGQTLQLLTLNEKQRETLLSFSHSGFTDKAELSPSMLKKINALFFHLQKHREKNLKIYRFFTHLPVSENLDDLVKASKKANLRSPQDRGFINICNLVGEFHEGYYNIDNDSTLYSRTVPVGLEESRCYGRCGPGCNSWSPVYTQECLNHDVCHRTTGENFGVCSDEWWDAAHGFVSASYCWL